MWQSTDSTSFSNWIFVEIEEQVLSVAPNRYRPTDGALNRHLKSTGAHRRVLPRNNGLRRTLLIIILARELRRPIQIGGTEAAEAGP